MKEWSHTSTSRKKEREKSQQDLQATIVKLKKDKFDGRERNAPSHKEKKGGGDQLLKRDGYVDLIEKNKAVKKQQQVKKQNPANALLIRGNCTGFKYIFLFYVVLRENKVDLKIMARNNHASNSPRLEFKRQWRRQTGQRGELLLTFLVPADSLY